GRGVTSHPRTVTEHMHLLDHERFSVSPVRGRAGEPVEDIEADLFNRADVQEMTVYSAENIHRCAKLLVRRSRGAADH
ncbi:MAG: hypothetical protein KJ621_10910, partial [Proteobacteria bacterium]|nr:hypothetical protein [Pseudomonadota bacterium]MBU1740278.1 hypothetical protein [Pseudomonadota bacterium]